MSWLDEVSFQSSLIILILNQSPICAVLALYSKTGGKNGKHSSVSESSNISAISYHGGSSFRTHVCSTILLCAGCHVAAMAIFQTCQFLLLSALHFWMLLDYKESSQQQTSILELSPADLDRFHTLQKANKQLQAAFKLSKK